jgi:hypothetical protein
MFLQSIYFPTNTHHNAKHITHKKFPTCFGIQGVTIIVYNYEIARTLLS